MSFLVVLALGFFVTCFFITLLLSVWQDFKLRYKFNFSTFLEL